MILTRLIRWLARAEIERECVMAYANGFNVGRAIGQGEMLAHLRGDVIEPVTSEAIQRRAAAMVH
ncbi:MAG: hypothetical protein NUV34_07535 [Sulfuricaulis sp.]|nr:hypothetical protein [Sulfuricaulis sp.]